MGNIFSLSTALKKAVESDRLTEFHYFSIIKKYWEVIIGDSLATRTAPAKLVNKTLYVLVEDAAYSQHLRYFTEQLIELIASPAILGEGKVLKVRFRVRSQKKEAEVRQEVKRPSIPLKSEELETVSQVYQVK